MEISCESCLATFPELKIIVSQFKCGICYEFMKTPVTTNCGHSYCSFCIRTWITTKQVCPTCQAAVRDESLRNNLALENCIDPYICLQNKLHEFCKAGVFKSLKPTAESTELLGYKTPEPPAKHCNSDIQTEPNEHNTGATRLENEPQIVHTPAKIPAVFLPSPKSKNQQRPMTDIFSSPTLSNASRAQNNFSASSSSQSTNVNKVPCPVCSVEIPERNINLHLDKCLTIDANALSSPRKPETARREPLKKLVYHMMSEKEIRKKLKEFCLSAKGDRCQLVNRLQRYTTLYNSECDSLNPRPVAEIRKQIEKDEETLSKIAPTPTKVFRLPKNADPTEIEEINKQYINENKSAFDDLVRQVRKRKKDSGPSDDCISPDRTTVKSNPWKSKANEQTNVTWPGTASKRNRISDDDSDEFSNSKWNINTSKSRRIDDSDDEDLFLPRTKENSQDTPVAPETSSARQDHKITNAEEVLRPILPNERPISCSSSTDDDLQILNENDSASPASPASPVFSRTSRNDSSDARKGRPSRQRPQREVKKTNVSPVEVRRPTRGKKNGNAAKPEELHRNLRKGRAKQASEPVRTVSRTPSLSPSRLEELCGNERENSETPERNFGTGRSRMPKGESDEEMDVGNDNLSQLVSLIRESGPKSSSPNRVTPRRSTRERKNTPALRSKPERK